ncbi:type VI secretion protein VasK [Enterobacter sp. A11]|uniref:ImcF-related family protein n=1 Tax=unclassified Enterobacter TaxID=2608935 RepID=UPI001070676A|nr:MULTISPECIES: ImcF-related family protein [unclassified Enterobacter]MBM1021658.1 type VI secretion protein VasK [Enterobacter sp. E1]MEA3563147.1 ImcF-related family protein [Enterobacter sp. GM-22]MEA3596555.1 ImcF-related family protein [Enterobacter sp. GM-31]TFF58029.1 type VI secretion protein VasK [Enterobacter sp. A11]
MTKLKEKAKEKSLLGATFLALIFLNAIIVFLLTSGSDYMASKFGLGPYAIERVLLVCATISVAVLLIAWGLEKHFFFAGRSGARKQWGKNKSDSASAPASNLANTFVDEKERIEGSFLAEPLIDHLRLRYGRRWKSKVRLLLVQGTDDHIEKVVPGLKRDHWQENDGIVLIHAGQAKATPEPEFVDVLNEVRPQRPLDGIVQVMDCAQLPDAAALDTLVRSRQKGDSLFGWQAPVWLWFIREEAWSQEGEGVPATGSLFGPGAAPEAAVESLTTLSSRLRDAGMPVLLSDTRHDWLLQLSDQLRGPLKQQLTPLLTSLMTGPAPYRLRGVMFSPAQVATPTQPNARLSPPAWQALEDDCLHVHARKIGFHWPRVLRLVLLALVLLWGAGTLLSLVVNRAQIYQAQETARVAADTRQPLTERLRNQLVLQQAIARLQDREAHGAPWYTTFGLNQDRETLNSLWPLYARNNHGLMRDALADELRRQLDAFVQLPPASDARTAATQKTYNLLKGYLMLGHPDKADGPWLAANMLKVWPTRAGVTDSAWQTEAPKLLGFYAQNLPSHPEWAIKPDAELVGTVRQILLKQIGQRNAESGLYQEMLQRIARNWPDLTLADMTSDTNASTLFSTEEVVPGMFTRQAWEEQVETAIDEVVKTRRAEIDWVLTDKTHQAGSDISPEALKQRLTERYFTDFGNAWLNLANSIQWHEAESLSEAIAQLNLLADVRQSPLVALMNTLAWQGQTGAKGEALADSIVDSAKKLVGRKKNAQQFIEQAQGPKGPLDGVFGPLNGLMVGKDGTGSNGNLSFQSWLARVTQVRLKLQQVTSAPDPQAMAQMLAQTVFQGKAIDLTDTRDYGSLVAASLGQEWNGFGQALFVQPLELAWRQVLAPAAGSLNARWQSTIVSQWNTAFAGRYPFKATGSDASLPLLAQFLRGDSGRIAAFLKTNLGGILHQEGNHWVVDPSASQGVTVNPAFLAAINQLADISDIVFAQGDAGVHFELMARPSRDVARIQLALDGQNLDYFNQMESWQSFTWPGNTYYPGVDLSWRSNTAGMRLYEHNQGNWGFIRLLDKALITPLDSSRTQLVWITQDGNPLKFIMRSELGDGPLALLKLQGFSLPASIFSVSADAVNNTFASTEGE